MANRGNGHCQQDCIAVCIVNLTIKTIPAILRLMRVHCLSCQNQWVTRGSALPRQCSSCWGRSLASEDELRLGGLVCHLLANASASRLPPAPPPNPLVGLGQFIAFPFSIKAYLDVMSRARDQLERRRAAALMLGYRGVGTATANSLANIMFP